VKEARKPYSVSLLVDVFGLVLFRESASQSLALSIIIFLKDKGKELACSGFFILWLVARRF